MSTLRTWPTTEIHARIHIFLSPVVAICIPDLFLRMNEWAEQIAEVAHYFEIPVILFDVFRRWLCVCVGVRMIGGWCSTTRTTEINRRRELHT